MKILFLVLLCCLSYLPTLGSEFKFDDFEYIDPAIGHHYSSLVELFTQSKNLHFNPLNYLFNDTLFAIWGHQHAWPFHLLNIVLFSLNVLLLYKIAALLTKSRSAAIFAAVLFSLHPVNAEMVNQVVFNTVFIAALCFQLVVLIFDQYLSTPSKKRLLAALVISLVAILTLEASMILPLYLFSWAYFVRGKNFKSAIRSTFWFWLFAGGLLLTWFFISCGSSLPSDVVPRLKYLALTPVSFIGTLISLVFWYLQKLILPVGHVWIYGVQPLKTLPSVAYIFLAFLIAVLAYYFRRRIFSSGMAGLLLIWFCAGFLFLVPGSLAHPENGLVIEPYWFYVSSMGFFIFAGFLLDILRNKIGKIVFLCFVGTLCFALSLLTQRFNIIAKTQKSYSQYWFQTSANSIALTTLAKTIYDENDYVLAAQYYELYLKRFAWSPYSRDRADRIYTNLGAIYVDLGDIPKAKEMIATALQVGSSNSRTDTVCGVISFKERDFTKAAVYFKRAIELDPQNVLNRFNLEELYFQLGQIKNATDVLEQLLKMDLSGSDRTNVLSRLAVLQFLYQDKDASMATVDKLFKNDSSAAAYLILAKTFHTSGESEPARIILSQGLKIYPGDKRLISLMAELVNKK